MPKHQCSINIPALVIGAWSFIGHWDLVIGHCRLFRLLAGAQEQAHAADRRDRDAGDRLGGLDQRHHAELHPTIGSTSDPTPRISSNTPKRAMARLSPGGMRRVLSGPRRPRRGVALRYIVQHQHPVEKFPRLRRNKPPLAPRFKLPNRLSLSRARVEPPRFGPRAFDRVHADGERAAPAAFIRRSRDNGNPLAADNARGRRTADSAQGQPRAHTGLARRTRLAPPVRPRGGRCPAAAGTTTWRRPRRAPQRRGSRRRTAGRRCPARWSP